MKASLFCRFISTLGPVGYLPAAGTAGTICAFFFLSGIRWSMLDGFLQLMVIASASLVSYYIINYALRTFNEQDPSAIVLDEVIGSLCALYMMPSKWYACITVFIWFRLFDIYKPFGIKRIEQIPGAWGVLLDDMAAAILANVITRVLLIVVL